MCQGFLAVCFHCGAIWASLQQLELGMSCTGDSTKQVWYLYQSVSSLGISTSERVLESLNIAITIKPTVSYTCSLSHAVSSLWAVVSSWKMHVAQRPKSWPARRRHVKTPTSSALPAPTLHTPPRAPSAACSIINHRWSGVSAGSLGQGCRKEARQKEVQSVPERGHRLDFISTPSLDRNCLRLPCTHLPLHFFGLDHRSSPDTRAAMR